MASDSSGLDVWASLAAHLDPTAWKPQLAEDIETARFTAATGESYVIAANPRDLVHYRLRPWEADLLHALDGSRTLAEIAVDELTDGRGLELGDIVRLARQLERGGFLAEPYVDIERALSGALRVRRWYDSLAGFLRNLSIEWRGAHGLVAFLYRQALRHLFTRAGLCLSALVSVAGLLAFLDVTHRHELTIENRHFGVTFGVLLALDLAVVFIHELGHASVLVHFGRRVKAAGFRIYFGAPSFFVDSPDVLLLPRGKRIAQAAAGVGLESVATGAAAVALWLEPAAPWADVLYQFVAISYVVMLMNLVPFLELDGYWMLSDALREPDLRPQSFAFVRHQLLPRLRTRGQLSRRELGLTIFGLAGAVFTVASLFFAWLFWRRVFGDSIRTLWDAGFPGRALLLVLTGLVAAPAINGLGSVSRDARRAISAQREALRFRRERSWRVEAAELLDGSGLFGDVPVGVLNELAGRARLRTVAPGAVVVRQGAEADRFYLVRAGSFEVVEERADTRVAPVLRTVRRGEGFGEAGLLQGAQRTATVRAAQASAVFEFDKSTFERLLAHRAQWGGFAPTWQQTKEVRALPPFAHLSDADVDALARRGGWRNVAPGEVVLTQGEAGDAFYVVQSGRIELFQDGLLVRTVGPGEHFGERALLTDEPRNATARAATPVRLYRLDRAAFTAMLAADLSRSAVEATEQPGRGH